MLHLILLQMEFTTVTASLCNHKHMKSFSPSTNQLNPNTLVLNQNTLMLLILLVTPMCMTVCHNKIMKIISARRHSACQLWTTQPSTQCVRMRKYRRVKNNKVVDTMKRITLSYTSCTRSVICEPSGCINTVL